jgi:hypothetical protein
MTVTAGQPPGIKHRVNVHAKSRLTPESLRTLRAEDKGQAGACPNGTRAIPSKVRAVTAQFPEKRYSFMVAARTGAPGSLVPFLDGTRDGATRSTLDAAGRPARRWKGTTVPKHAQEVCAVRDRT